MIMATSDLFPVIYSTLDSEALSLMVLPYYNLNQVKYCQFWTRGLSDIYVVETDDERYILRVSHYHWRKKTEIDFELELLDFLSQNNLPVAYPIKTKNQELSVEINAPEGKRYATLFIYAPGQIALGDLNKDQGFLLGYTLANLHLVGARFSCSHERTPLNTEYLLDHSRSIIAPFLNSHQDELKQLDNIIDDIKIKLDIIPQKPPFWGICWGDPHSGNVHFTPEGKITLFDFDQCGYGWHIFDIAKFLQVSLRTGISKTVRDAFIMGYQTVKVLSDLEINLLQSFTEMAHIWMWAINIQSSKLYNYCRLDDYYLRNRLDQLKRLNSHDWQLF
jgi:Ser/Thr protein kinase RdoA (MazF antagonist)